MNNKLDSRLRSAARNGDASVVYAMLAAGANANAATQKKGETPLKLALARQDETIANVLLQYENGASGDWCDLVLCIKKDYFGALTVWRSKSGSLDESNAIGDTALHKASMWRKHEAMRILLDAGALASPTNRLGDTPLHKASWIGDNEQIELLLSYGTDPNASNHFGETGLHYALFRGFSVVARQLLDAGAKSMIHDCHGLTPSDYLHGGELSAFLDGC